MEYGKERGKQAFKIALKGEDNRSDTWEKFDHSMLL